MMQPNSVAPGHQRSVIGVRPAGPAAAPTPAAAAAHGKSHARANFGAFFIENMERCQADVRDFLHTEGDSVTYSGILDQ